MDDVTLARAVHVLSLVHWIGGVAFVTLVVLPVSRRAVDSRQRLALFESVERRFVPQVRLSMPLAGASGFYMAERLDAWPRFVDPGQWWLGARLLLWLVFMASCSSSSLRLAIASWKPAASMRSAHYACSNAVVMAAAMLGAHGFLP